MRRSAEIATRLALVGATFAATMQVVAQETPKGMIRAVPERPTRVFIMAAFDDDCRPLAAPRIEVTKAPAKGEVQFREGQGTTVQFSASGKCIGAKVTGTGIYYAARAGADGEDTFTITARLASGEVSERTFNMFVTEGLQ